MPSKKEVDLEHEKRFLVILEEAYPWIHWEESIKIATLAGSEHFGCRICIAKYGIHGSEIQYLPATLEAHQRHMRERHGITEFKI